jgi:hypothetical protein
LGVVKVRKKEQLHRADALRLLENQLCFHITALSFFLPTRSRPRYLRLAGGFELHIARFKNFMACILLVVNQAIFLSKATEQIGINSTLFHQIVTAFT